MVNSIKPVDSIVIQLNNTKLSNRQDPDEAVKGQNNQVQLNLDISEDTLTRAVEKVNKSFMLENKRMEISYQKDTNTYVVKIIDRDTNEVVTQIPSQKLLDYASGLMEYIGILTDTKV